MAADASSEADRIDGVPLPQETTALFGHTAAARRLHEAYLSESMHHAWLVTGPKGIGKATLAFGFARFVLSHTDPRRAPPVDGGILQPVSPKVFGPLAQNAHPNLLHLKRPWQPERDRFAQDLTVTEIRRLSGFFGQTAGSDGLRIAIIDAADDMNASAANALLKLLEEPPRRSLFFVLGHQPGRLLPTIRSRCARLPLRPLAPHDLAAALNHLGLAFDGEETQLLFRLSEGSVRKAVELLHADGLKLHAVFSALLGRPRPLDRPRLHALADMVTGRDGEGRFALLIDFARSWLGERVRAEAATGAGAVKPYADAAAEIEKLVAEADAYNLDRRQLLFELVTVLGMAAG